MVAVACGAWAWLSPWVWWLAAWAWWVAGWAWHVLSSVATVAWILKGLFVRREPAAGEG